MSARARRLLFVIGAALLVLAALGLDQAQMVTGVGLPVRSGSPMAIVAHRGDTSAYPEDTVEAVLEAARTGADGIEVDVHQSADGTWWLIHDASVDRTTDGTGLVHELSDLELASLTVDGGRGFDRQRHPRQGLATLAEMLRRLGGYDGVVYVDLQHAVAADPTDLATHLADVMAVVLCRGPDDARAVEDVDARIGTAIRGDGIDRESDVDLVFLEAVGEATVGRVAKHTRPVVTYMDDRYEHLSQDTILRRAWAAGVSVFLAKDLAAAVALRDELAAGSDAP